jgi:hypothetical protein
MADYQSQRTEEPIQVDPPERLLEADFLLIPGFAGRDIELPKTGEVVYPSGTGDLMKLLREADATIEYADPDQPRVPLKLMAAEYWVPIVVMVKDLLVGVEGALLVDAIRAWIGHGGSGKTVDEPTEEREPILHLKVGAADLERGTVEWFEASGRRDDVFKGYEDFRAR